MGAIQMNDTWVIQLTTLWFVVLIFLQTGSGSADGPTIAAITVLAVVLSYVLPVAILGLLGLRVLGD